MCNLHLVFFQITCNSNTSLKFICKSSEIDNVWKSNKKHLREKILKTVAIGWNSGMFNLEGMDF